MALITAKVSLGQHSKLIKYQNRMFDVSTSWNFLQTDISRIAYFTLEHERSPISITRPRGIQFAFLSLLAYLFAYLARIEGII